MDNNTSLTTEDSNSSLISGNISDKDMEFSVNNEIELDEKTKDTLEYVPEYLRGNVGRVKLNIFAKLKTTDENRNINGGFVLYDKQGREFFEGKYDADNDKLTGKYKYYNDEGKLRATYDGEFTKDGIPFGKGEMATYTENHTIIKNSTIKSENWAGHFTAYNATISKVYDNKGNSVGKFTGTLENGLICEGKYGKSEKIQNNELDINLGFNKDDNIPNKATSLNKKANVDNKQLKDKAKANAKEQEGKKQNKENDKGRAPDNVKRNDNKDIDIMKHIAIGAGLTILIPPFPFGVLLGALLGLFVGATRKLISTLSSVGSQTPMKHNELQNQQQKNNQLTAETQQQGMQSNQINKDENLNKNNNEQQSSLNSFKGITTENKNNEQSHQKDNSSTFNSLSNIDTNKQTQSNSVISNKPKQQEQGQQTV